MPVSSTPKVSAVVATYNGSQYLAEQLESILAQTLAPTEIIVSDDGSSDSTLDIVAKFHSAQPRKGAPAWRVLSRKKPLGVAGNFASALTATLDGLGAVGDGAHAEHEHVIVERMPERAALLAVLLSNPPEGTQ